VFLNANKTDSTQLKVLNLFIIKSFNKRWFQGWEATLEVQRVKFVSLARKMKEHLDYEEKHAENSMPKTRR
jgi:type I restriction enzyme, R subunit